MVAQMVKNLPAMQETRAPSLHQENLLEKGSVSGPKQWHLSHGTADSIGSGSLAFHFIKIHFMLVFFFLIFIWLQHVESLIESCRI